jgi:hypothetical protein
MSESKKNRFANRLMTGVISDMSISDKLRRVSATWQSSSRRVEIVVQMDGLDSREGGADCKCFERTASGRALFKEMLVSLSQAIGAQPIDWCGRPVHVLFDEEGDMIAIGNGMLWGLEVLKPCPLPLRSREDVNGCEAPASSDEDVREECRCLRE